MYTVTITDEDGKIQAVIPLEATDWTAARYIFEVNLRTFLSDPLLGKGAKIALHQTTNQTTNQTIEEYTKTHR